MADDKAEQALEACQDTVDELKVQNDELREAAGTSGQLAERVRILSTRTHPLCEAR